MQNLYDEVVEEQHLVTSDDDDSDSNEVFSCIFEFYFIVY